MFEVDYMRKITLVALFLSSPVSAQTTGTASIGGQITNNGVNQNSNVEILSRHSGHTGSYELGNTFQRANGKTVTNVINLDVKQNFDLNKSLYSMNEFRYDFNANRAWNHTAVFGSGLGIRLYNKGDLKISDELSGGIRITDFGKYPVMRNTFWVRYNRDRVTLYSKWLYERSDISYYQEQSGVSVQVYKRITLGISHQYQRDIKTTEITAFNLGLKF
jgi:hypothetical protein